MVSPASRVWRKWAAPASSAGAALQAADLARQRSLGVYTFRLDESCRIRAVGVRREEQSEATAMLPTRIFYGSGSTDVDSWTSGVTRPPGVPNNVRGVS